ncbi:hypothetical protein HDU67_003871 [Dinochytrium kinnereticum]|nr:hypothetical protein HDU67_003871 [Dinochytrium kinnereticum]
MLGFEEKLRSLVDDVDSDVRGRVRTALSNFGITLPPGSLAASGSGDVSAMETGEGEPTPPVANDEFGHREGRVDMERFLQRSQSIRKAQEERFESERRALLAVERNALRALQMLDGRRERVGRMLDGMMLEGRRSATGVNGGRGGGGARSMPAVKLNRGRNGVEDGGWGGFMGETLLPPQRHKKDFHFIPPTLRLPPRHASTIEEEKEGEGEDQTISRGSSTVSMVDEIRRKEEEILLRFRMNLEREDGIVSQFLEDGSDEDADDRVHCAQFGLGLKHRAVALMQFYSEFMEELAGAATAGGCECE